MMRFELVSERPTRGRRHVMVDGRRHILLELDSLVALGYDCAGSVTYPPSVPGYATTTVGTSRFAAWFGGAR